jgi:GxxExxY protein
MNTDSKPISFSILVEGELTEKIIGAAFKVQNTLGAGFLEKVYENSLAIELRKIGLAVESQTPYSVLYEGIVVRDYQADLVVGGKVILECKAVSALDRVHEAQLLNYLKASGLHVGLLINFGRPKLQYRRLVL